MVRGLSLPWWAHTREVETAVPSNSRCDQVPVNTISCLLSYTVLCPCTYRRSLHHPSPQSASLAAPSTLTGESNASAAML
jgi:hypothetical protein